MARAPLKLKGHACGDCCGLQERQAEAAGVDVKVDLAPDEWAVADDLGRRLRAAAKIAGASADVAAPLLLSSDTKVLELSVQHVVHLIYVYEM